MRRFVLYSLVVLGLAYVIGIPLFLGHEDDSLPKGADAVVALAGSEKTLPAAQQLIGGGIAPTLVVSAERNNRDKRRRSLCRSKADDVVCVYAGPYSSVGEAKAISQLAKRRNWDTIVLVTGSIPACGPIPRGKDILLEVRRTAPTTPVAIHAISLGLESDADFLQELAEATGGSSQHRVD